MDEKSIENLQPRLRIFILCDFHLRCGSTSALVGLTFKTTLKPRSSVMSVSSLPPICWQPRRGRCRGRRWWPHRVASWPGPALASASYKKCKTCKKLSWGSIRTSIWYGMCMYCMIKLYANYVSLVMHPMLRIRIRRIPMFLALPDPDPLVRGTDPVTDPDPSIIKQN